MITSEILSQPPSADAIVQPALGISRIPSPGMAPGELISNPGPAAFDLDEESFTAAEQALAGARLCAQHQPQHVPIASLPPIHREPHLAAAEQIAAVLRQFLDLTASGAHSARTAAATLRKPVGWFTGPESYLARFQRAGLAGLVQSALAAPRPGGAMGCGTLPHWFIKAAQFFYVLSNHRRAGGSVPEAVRRAISLPAVPFGWTDHHKNRLVKLLSPVAMPQASLPSFPMHLRETIIAREKSGLPLVPRTIAKQIAVPEAVIQQYRSPRAGALDNLCAPGSQRRYFNARAGQRQIMLPGDWFGGDDSTPGIAVCVPSAEVLTPCSTKFGVLLGRFQWLAYHDCRSDKILATDHVIRPRGSYRAEDVLNGMGAVTRAHGIPRIGWQFEGGTYNAKIIQHAIKLMACEHWRTYSPHQKAIESIFNRVWTRLAVQFPHADMGRYRAENEANCKLYEECKHGHKDPRKYFPTLEILVRAFDEEVIFHNAKQIRSVQYGTWTPNDLFDSYCGRSRGNEALNNPALCLCASVANPLREFSESMSWIFSPFTAERKINGMLVKVSVPMFENFSVPFEFSAPWMPLHRGKKVRIHFNPREPKCRAKVILTEDSGTAREGDILGDADLIGETAQHIRQVMAWADDDQRAGYVARQRTAHFLRRQTRALGANGRVLYAAAETRDGLGTVLKSEVGTVRAACGAAPAVPAAQSGGTETPAPKTSRSEREARSAELDQFARNHQHII